MAEGPGLSATRAGGAAYKSAGPETEVTRVRIRKLVRWIALAVGAIVLLVGLYLSVFFLPYPLFRHHTTGAGFSVYCDREVPEGFGPVLEEARRRVEAMPLYRGSPLPRIFVCRSQRLFELLVKLAGKRHAGQGLLISAARNMFLSEHGIATVARRNAEGPTHSRLEGSWSEAIAHEVAHQLMTDELGFRRMRGVPAWKAEGYADYSAALGELERDRSSDLASRVEVLLDDEAWRGATARIDRRHFRWQLEVEYLCSVRGLDLTSLLAPDITEEEARREMMGWWKGHEPPHPPVTR